MICRPISGNRLSVITTMLMCATAMADVFILKDGSRLDGSILSETADSYLIEVQVTRSIKDERRIAKDQIASIERREKDVGDFEALAPLADIPDILPAAAYRARIERLKAFEAAYPKSTSLPKVKEILAAHETELAVIDAGGVKLHGKLITPEERLANAYEIDSQVKAAEITRHAVDGSLLAALRDFQLMEENFPGSEAWHALLPTIRKICSVHRSNTARLLNEYEQRIASQQSGLTLLSPDERQRVQRDIELRDARLKQRHDQEKANRINWVTPNEYFKPSLEETVRTADQELKRLEAAMAAPLPTPSPSELWRNAHTAIRSGDSRAITDAIAAARNARMSASYLERLQQLASTPE
jgi:hypothetical protein